MILILYAYTVGINFVQGKPQFLSTIIKDTLQLQNEVTVIGGANVASDIAHNNFVETTCACKDLTIAEDVSRIFRSQNFCIDITDDVFGVELFGALKNVIAIGAGMLVGTYCRIAIAYIANTYLFYTWCGHGQGYAMAWGTDAARKQP